VTPAERRWHQEVDREIVDHDVQQHDWLTASRLTATRDAYLNALRERADFLDEMHRSR
jgi:hypothetical protein